MINIKTAFCYLNLHSWVINKAIDTRGNQFNFIRSCSCGKQQVLKRVAVSYPSSIFKWKDL